MKNFRCRWNRKHLGFCFLVFAELSSLEAGIEERALVRHSPNINGRVEGSVQQLLGEPVTLNSQAFITGDWFFPGTPTFRFNGDPDHGGILEGEGALAPSGYTFRMNNNAHVRNLVTRTDPVTAPLPEAPTPPTGSRWVNVNSTDDQLGDFSTIYGLNMNQGAGEVVVPPGAYGQFNVNGGILTLGVPGDDTPAIYSLQHLNLNGQGLLHLQGPVILRLQNGPNFNSDAGNSAHPEWLRIELRGGTMNINSQSEAWAHIYAPATQVHINGELTGGIVSNRLTVNAQGVLRLTESLLGNRPPTADAGAFELDEDAGTSFDLKPLASDPDGDDLEFVLEEGPRVGTALLSSDGQLQYMPAEDYFGEDTLVYRVTDGQIDSASAVVTITVMPVNDAPVANNASFPITEDTEITGSLSASDVDGDPLTFSLATTPAHGAVIVAPDGTFTYAPKSDFHGEDSFEFLVSDGSASSALSMVELVIAPVNDAPTIFTHAFETPEDTGLSEVLTAHDVDGDELTFALSAVPSWGTASVDADGSFIYQPNANAHGSDGFEVTVSDSMSAVSFVVDVVVTPVNDVPVAENESFSTVEDTGLSGLLTASDADGDDLTFTLGTGPNHGTVAVGPDGSFTYTPTVNFHGEDSFTFSVSDGAMASAEFAVHITVAAVNDAPVANNQYFVTDEDVELSGTLTAKDDDGDHLTFSLGAAPSHGTVFLQPDGSFVFIPLADFYGEDDFTVGVGDGVAPSTEFTVQVTVRPVNDLPSLGVSVFSTDEDVELGGALEVVDPDGDVVAVALVTEPAHAAFRLRADGSFTYTPAVNFSGEDRFSVELNDGSAVVSSEVIVKVSPQNDAPVVVDQVFGIIEGKTLSDVLSAKDIDGDLLTFALTSSPQSGTLLLQPDGSFSYMPNAGFVGLDSFSVSVDDGAYSVSFRVSVEVMTSNQPPVITNEPDVPRVDLASFDRVNMRNWTIHHMPWHTTGGHGTAQWRIYDDFGFEATQTANNFASVFLSDFTFGEGRIEVEFNATGYSDNDGIGFVWGYHDAYDHNRFNWNANEYPGMTFVVPTGETRINSIPWEHNVDYRFVLERWGNTADVQVFEGDILIGSGVLETDDNGEGPIGLYTISQEGVIFKNLRVFHNGSRFWRHQVVANDPDGDALEFQLMEAPVGASMDPETGEIVWEIFERETGSVRFHWQVMDGKGGIDEQVLEIPVYRNTAPTIALSSERVFSDNGLVELDAAVFDDHYPTGRLLQAEWTQVVGPSNANFLSPTILKGSTGNLAAGLRLSLPQAGHYIFEVSASDGDRESSAFVYVDYQFECEVEADPSIVAWWSGDFVADDVANGLTPAEIPTEYRAGRVRGAFVLASGQSLQVPANPTLDIAANEGDFTIEWWQNKFGATDQVLFGWYDPETLEPGLQVRVRDYSNLLIVESAAGGSWGWQASRTDAWVHYALTYRAAAKQLHLYRDGRLFGSADIGANEFDTSGDFYLGRAPSGLPRFYTGLMDEFTVYERALSASEVYAIAEAGARGKCLPSSNTAPSVDAGPNIGISSPTFQLRGTVQDDQSPSGSLISRWTQLHGPVDGFAVFVDDGNPATEVNFSVPGRYVLELRSSDGEKEAWDVVEIKVDQACSFEAPDGVVAWWAGEHSALERVNGLPAGSIGLDFSPGMVGAAFSMNGYSRLHVPAHGLLDVATSEDGFSIEWWQNKTGNSDEVLFGWYDPETLEHGLRVRVRGYSSYFIVESSQGGDSWMWNASRTDQWVHYALVYEPDTTSLKLYRSGKLFGNLQVSANSFITSGDIYIGGGSLSTQPGYVGLIDEFTLYRRALTAQEVAMVCESESLGKCVPSNNHAPFVEAGTDIGVHGLTTVLDGSASDDDLPHGTLTTEWSLLMVPSGSTATFDDSASLNTSVSFSGPGRYVIKLTASDGEKESSDVIRITAGQPCSVPPPSDMIVWWSGDYTGLNEVSGNLAGLVGMDFSKGHVGGAFELGTYARLYDDSKEVSNLGHEANGFTIEWWQKKNGTSDQVLFGWYDPETLEHRFRVRVRGYSSAFILESANGSINWQTNASQVDRWIHYSITYDRQLQVVHLYRNGRLYGSSPVGAAGIDANGEFYLGGGPKSATSGYNGLFDEFCIYGRALSPTEVYAVYSAGETGKCLLGNNEAPAVNAGFDRSIGDLSTHLKGIALDDGLPLGALQKEWRVREAPAGAMVQFQNQNDAATGITFTHPGRYVLELYASDGERSASDFVTLSVQGDCTDASALLPSIALHLSGDYVVADATGRADPGAIGVDFTSGKVGGALRFDGLDYVYVPSSDNLNIASGSDGFAIEWWSYKSGSSDRVLFGWYDPVTHAHGLRVRVRSWSRSFIIESQAGGSSWAWGANTWDAWTHYAISVDYANDEIRLYRNGAQVGSSAMGGAIIDTSGDFYLSGIPRTGSSGFSGMFDEFTLYRQPLSQAEVADIYTASGSGKCPFLPPNEAPFVSSGSDFEVTLGSGPAQLRGLVSDEGLPASGTLTHGWTQVSGPAIITFSAALLQPTIEFSREGVYVFELFASDGEFSTSDTVTVTVHPKPNEAPILAVPDPFTVNVMEAVDVIVDLTDDGVPAGNDLVVSWTVISGNVDAVELVTDSASVSVDPYETTSHATALAIALPGTYELAVTVSDGKLTASDIITVTAVSAPVVKWFDPVDGAGVRTNQPFDLIVEAYDAFEPLDWVAFYRDGALLGQGTSIDGTVGWTLEQPALPEGTYVFTALAQDVGGLTTSSDITVYVVDDPGTPPIAEIASPAAHARVTAPTIVTGTANSPILESWTLEYRRNGSEAWHDISGLGLPASAVSSPVNNGDFGTFDPTLLRNGVYELRLTVRDLLGRVSVDTVSVAVTGGMKIGHFALAFEDLNVPVGGIPIQVIRSYDSRPGAAGDFGPRWELSIRAVQVFESGVVGGGWEDYIDRYQPVTGIPIYRIRPIERHVVSVVIDDEVQQFEAYSPTEQGFFPLGAAAIAFRPINGSDGSLELVNGGNFSIERNGGEVSLTDFFDVVDPEDYRYVAVDGTEMEIRQVLGLRKLTDLDGNALTITEDGITNSDGVGILLTRDAEGRITEITDPAGHVLSYDYDDKGRLQFFTNRVGDVTEYRYQNARFPHYLTEVVDPSGNAAIACEYGDDGRLLSQTDASGHTIGLTHDLLTRTEIVTDRLGNETVYEYDLRGNVVRQTDALGSTVTYTYWPDSDEVMFETDHLGNVKSMAYDANDNLLFETIGADPTEDPAAPTSGYTTAYTYNVLGAPTSITDANGNVTEFGYDPATNNLLTQTDYEFDGTTHTTTFTYTPSGEIATMTDPAGNTTTYTYNESFSDSAYPGAVKEQTVTVTDASGGVLRSSRSLFDRQGNQLAEIATHTVYSIGGGSVAETSVTEFRYDAENRLIATIAPDPDGSGPLTRQVTETRYNALGKQAATLVWKSLADYDSANEALARITAMSYNEGGNLIATIFPDGAMERSGYDPENRRVWSQNRNGHTTYYVHDALGRTTHTIFPDDTTPDPDGLSDEQLRPAALLANADLADNPRTETVYDAIGRVTLSINEQGGVTETVYEAGCGCSQRRKQTIRYVTDADGQRQSLATQYAYDPAGNIRFVIDPRGNTTETVYDSRNRPTSVILPATEEHGTSATYTEYDALGRRAATIDAAGNRTDYNYDGLGRLVEVVQPAPSASDPRPSTRYVYDQADNRLAEIDANGHATVFAYDKLGRRVSRTVGVEVSNPGNLDWSDPAAVFSAFTLSAEAATQFMTYDAWGRLVSKTDFSGYTTTYTYHPDTDYLHEEIADPSHPSLVLAHAPAKYVYNYDAVGNRVGTTVFNAPLHGEQVLYREIWTYDDRGRPDLRQTSLGSVDYAFDAAGNLSEIITSTTDGAWLSYSYDELNRLAAVDDHRSAPTTYTYNANGSVKTVKYGDPAIVGQIGVTHTYAYDALNRLRTLHLTGREGSTLHSYEYLLKISGHRDRVTENTGRVSSYTYDRLHRMTAEVITGDPHGMNGSATYGLDAVGNRTDRFSTIDLLVEQRDLTYNTRDWLDFDSYDFNGNTVRSVTGVPAVEVTDSYDFRNHLIRRTTASGTIIDLYYDADGIRIGKRLDDGAGNIKTEWWLVDSLNPTGYAQVLEEFSGDPAASSAEAAYLAGLDLARVNSIGLDLIGYDARDETGTWHLRYYGYDGHGSVRELLATETYTYDAFGVLLNTSTFIPQPSTLQNSYLYTGERWDKDLGLYYLRARYMNPRTGRFHTMDTYEGSMADPVTLHKYLYANGNPVMFADPSGNMSLAGQLLAVSITGSLANMAIALGAFNGIATGGGLSDPDYIGVLGSAGVNTPSSRLGVSGSGSVQFGYVHDRRSSQGYLSLGASVGIGFLGGKSKPSVLKFGGELALLWNGGKPLVSGKGAHPSASANFVNLSSGYSIGAARVLLLAFGGSVIDDGIASSLRRVLAKLAKTPLKNMRMSVGTSFGRGNASIKFIYSSAGGGNAPFGIGVFGFAGLTRYSFNPFPQVSQPIRSDDDFVGMLTSFRI